MCRKAARIFPNMTVRENLDLGAYRRGRARPRAEPRHACSRSSRACRTAAPARRHAVRRRAADAGDRPRPDGRAAAADPRRASLGLSPLLVEELFALIKSINAEGIALLLVEQNVVQSLEVAQRAYILDNGRFVLEGSAADIRNDPDLKRAYLGM